MSGKRLGCLDAVDLTLGASISAYLFIFCCRSGVIFYYKSRVAAGVLTHLLCSIILAGCDQIDESLEDLNDLTKSVGNPGAGLI